jgi:hypothetical protein
MKQDEFKMVLRLSKENRLLHSSFHSTFSFGTLIGIIGEEEEYASP